MADKIKGAFAETDPKIKDKLQNLINAIYKRSTEDGDDGLTSNRIGLSVSRPKTTYSFKVS